MIVIFAGAGASMAVSSSFPTTAEFMEKLPHAATNKAFDVVNQYYRNQTRSTIVDIETILWGYSELLAWVDQSTDRNSLIGWLMAGNKFNEMHNTVGHTDKAANGLNSVRNLIETSMDHINRQVYDLYGTRPEPTMLAGNWSQLLDSLSADHPVEIFTTNYDLVIETALQQKELDMAAATGRITDGMSMKIDQNIWRERMAQAGEIGFFLTKLHGSVDWEWDGDEIVVTTPRFSGDHDHHSIIYPGFKGQPDSDPFALFHDYLRNRVSRANAIVFIGYAFRDDFINQVMRGKNNNADVIIINPSIDRKSIPISGRQGKPPVIISDGFGEKSVHLLLKKLAPLVSGQ